MYWRPRNEGRPLWLAFYIFNPLHKPDAIGDGRRDTGDIFGAL